jgi:hypothetical protein
MRKTKLLNDTSIQTHNDKKHIIRMELILIVFGTILFILFYYRNQIADNYYRIRGYPIGKYSCVLTEWHMIWAQSTIELFPNGTAKYSMGEDYTMGTWKYSEYTKELVTSQYGTFYITTPDSISRIDENEQETGISCTREK